MYFYITMQIASKWHFQNICRMRRIQRVHVFTYGKVRALTDKTHIDQAMVDLGGT